MRITVVIELTCHREESGKLIAAGVVMADDGVDALIAEYEARNEEFEGYPWIAKAGIREESWDIRFPSPSVDTPYNEHETDFIIDSIRLALANYINSFVFSDACPP